MLTTVVILGGALWLLERLAFALLLLWLWDALVFYTDELGRELDRLRPGWL